jgi:hypothetical protein
MLAVLVSSQALAADDDALSLKIRNTTLETEVLTLRQQLRAVAAERDRAVDEAGRVQEELDAIRAKIDEVANRIFELERELQSARAAAQESAQRERDGSPQEKDRAPPRPLSSSVDPSPPLHAASAGAQRVIAALEPAITAFRTETLSAPAKAKLASLSGTTLHEADIEQAATMLIDKKSIASWTKYGSEAAGLGYLLVTKVSGSRFVGVINLSFNKLLNGRPEKLADIEALDQFFPVEIRGYENWDEIRVSWLYEDGDFLGALPHVAPMRGPWTIVDYLRSRRTEGPGATTIFESKGKLEAIPPATLADLEKKEPAKFARFGAASDGAGYPKIHVAMYRNSVGLDPAKLVQSVDFQKVPGLRESVEAAFKASLSRASRIKGVRDILYGRIAALILMPDFTLSAVGIVKEGAGTIARLTATYTDAAGQRQPARLDFGKEAGGERWLPVVAAR